MVAHRAALFLLASLSVGCSTPPEVKREGPVLLQFDVSAPEGEGDPTQVPRGLKTLWEGLLADLEADPASGHLLQELFSGLPIRLEVPEETTPEALGAPTEGGGLVLRVAERKPPELAALGTGWYRCVLVIDLARVGSLDRDTPKTKSDLVYDGEAGALKLLVEAYLRRKLASWSFGATPRRTTIGQRIEAFKKRNVWKRRD